jgi:hypothetical protein
VIVIPSTQSHPDQCKNFQDQFPQLSRSLTAMEEALTKRTVGCADIPNLYETIHVLITLKFINSILQREQKNVAGEVAALLGESQNPPQTNDLLTIKELIHLSTAPSI